MMRVLIIAERSDKRRDKRRRPIDRITAKTFIGKKLEKEDGKFYDKDNKTLLSGKYTLDEKYSNQILFFKFSISSTSTLALSLKPGSSGFKLPSLVSNLIISFLFVFSIIVAAINANNCFILLCFIII